MKKIFVFVESTHPLFGVNSVAICEDGNVLAGHISSNVSWAKHDMGVVGSEWKHEHYKAHCPDGFSLEWVDDPDSHAGVAEAGKKNKELAEAADKAGAA